MWDESENDYEAKSNGSGSTFIAPGQGFMVVGKNTSSTLTFNKNIRKHGAATFYKNSNDNKRFKLFVVDAENNKNSTLIAFLPNMTLGLDPSYDAAKLKGNPNIALYTRLVEDYEVDFAIQALPNNDIESLTIPVGIDVAESIMCEFSISPKIMEDYPVYLEDRLENTVTNLKEENYNTLPVFATP